MKLTIRVESDPLGPVATMGTWAGGMRSVSAEAQREVVIDLDGEFTPHLTAAILRAAADQIAGGR